MIKTDEGNLTIGVDDVGILSVDITAGDLNWSDIERALVFFSYEDKDVDRIEEQIQLSSAQPTHRIQKVIFQPMRKNYEYQIKYFMKDGRELLGSKQQGRSTSLFINDVFSARKTVGVRGIGDFAGRIRTIFLDLAYDDATNDYHLTKSIALDANTTFFDWSFPVISETAGVVTYSGNVAHKDGTSEAIDKQTAETNTILVPAPVEDFLEVMVVTDLIDWNTGAAGAGLAGLRRPRQPCVRAPGLHLQRAEQGRADLARRPQGPHPERLHLHGHLLHGGRHPRRGRADHDERPDPDPRSAPVSGVRAGG